MGKRMGREPPMIRLRWVERRGFTRGYPGAIRHNLIIFARATDVSVDPLSLRGECP
jgi:hypothetical protein